MLDKICDKIKYLKYLIGKKGGITNSINHNFGKIRINWYSSLPIKNILTFHIVIILIKSVVNKNENKFCYNTFLEKGLYKWKFQSAIFVYYEYYIMIELTFLKELMLKQVYENNVTFVTICIS